ncbi:unnamed protein product [Ectocarpus sp. 4 AP-2014]
MYIALLRYIYVILEEANKQQQLTTNTTNHPPTFLRSISRLLCPHRLPFQDRSQQHTACSPPAVVCRGLYQRDKGRRGYSHHTRVHKLEREDRLAQGGGVLSGPAAPAASAAEVLCDPCGVVWRSAINSIQPRGERDTDILQVDVLQRWGGLFYFSLFDLVGARTSSGRATQSDVDCPRHKSGLSWPQDNDVHRCAKRYVINRTANKQAPPSSPTEKRRNH